MDATRTDKNEGPSLDAGPMLARLAKVAPEIGDTAQVRRVVDRRAETIAEAAIALVRTGEFVLLRWNPLTVQRVRASKMNAENAEAAENAEMRGGGM